MRSLSASVLVVVVSVICGACSSSSSAPTSPSAPGVPPGAQGCARTSVGFSPLSDQGFRPYEDQSGGLYPGGNSPPLLHLLAGINAASSIGPLAADGTPDSSGRYGFVSIGMSNTTQEFQAFLPMANADPSRDPSLVLVDGAQGGQTAADWGNPGCPCWITLNARIQQAGLSARQVVVAWIKLANRQPTGPWPFATQQLKKDIATVVRELKARFPNLVVGYLSSRIYAGYATTTLNPEPYAYESGFAVRWVIEDQLNGLLPFQGPSAVAPWLAWGPYLWADGLTARSDGLTWACGDLADDGTHPSASGRQQVADLLLDFVRTDPTAREWFVRP